MRRVGETRGGSSRTVLQGPPGLCNICQSESRFGAIQALVLAEDSPCLGKGTSVAVSILLNQSESPVQQPEHLTCLIQMFPLYRAEINTGVQQGLHTAVAGEQQLWSRGLRRCDARRLLQEASPELHQPLVAWRELVQACLQVPITWPLSRAGFMEFPR